MERYLDISKILNLEHIAEIFDYLSKVTNMGITFLDSKGNFLINLKGQNPFCILVGKSDNGVRCRQSDLSNLKQAAKMRKPIIYTCFAGLVDAIIPVYYGKKFIGAAVTGQIRLKDVSSDAVMRLTDDKNIKKELISLYNKTNVYTKKMFSDICWLIFHILNYVINKEIGSIVEIENSKNMDAKRNTLEKARVYIGQNYKDELNLTKISEIFHFPADYFSKLFKIYYGITFKSYIINLRIEEAKRLFSDINKSVSEVAFDVGFNDSNYFSTVFKKVTGMTPRGFKYKIARSNSKKSRLNSNYSR